MPRSGRRRARAESWRCHRRAGIVIFGICAAVVGLSPVTIRGEGQGLSDRDLAAPVSTVVPLWPQDDLAAVTREIIVLDSPDDPNAIKRLVLRPSLVLYRPAPGQSNHRAVLVIPGGAYRRLYLTRGGYDFADFLVAHGYTVGLLRYRMARPAETGAGKPLPLIDAERGLRLLRSRAAELGCDQQRIGLVGSSAGGHLAGSCAAFGDDGNPQAADSVERVSSRPYFLVLHSPLISMDAAVINPTMRADFLGKAPSAALVRQYSLEEQVGPRWPPTLLVSTRDDRLYPNTARLVPALQRAGRPADTLIFERGGHTPGLFELPVPLREWPRQWLEWMDARYSSPR